MNSISWKPVIIVAVFLAAIVYILPTFIPNFPLQKKINLGLDLQGGMHLVLEVDSDKAVASTIERTAQELKDRSRRAKVRRALIEKVDGNRIQVSIQGADNIKVFEKLLDDEFRNLRIQDRSRDGERLSLTLDLPDQETDRIKELAVAQALETIRNRIDQFGVSEPDIRRQGDKRLLIQLPGIKDTKRAKELIGRTAQLEFKLVDERMPAQTALKEGPPPGTEILYQVTTDTATQRKIEEPYLIKKRTVLTGAYLTDARVRFDQQDRNYYVAIDFDRKGARIFERVTGDNVRKRLAIVLDRKVHSAPVIQGRIAGGQAVITGNFSAEEAEDLAIVLRAGALPAPVRTLEERTVGPSLGKDSIDKGLISMIVGGLLVVLFMVIYYKGAGLLADFALVMNILLMGAGLAAFQATLTLPGIAGFILTIGMAVDANVIIFERIREELRIGKPPRAAVDAGYNRATLTILDANVTTLIAALVLFQFGTGPIKGFAVTLSLGVIASMFTSLVFTRWVFDFILAGRKVVRISI
ncbi:MAG: protein translocase subunit SecD [Desulfosarcina sp.]|nr:protein translocase subunit SecD [Desulfobacterales bacterium]